MCQNQTESNNLAAKPKLATFVKYAKVELIPPNPAEIPEIARGFRNLVRGTRSGAWRQLTMKEAAVNIGITVEIICWFFIGECIGKGGIIGYGVGKAH